MYTDYDVETILEKAIKARSNPKDKFLVKLAPIDMRKSRDNLIKSCLDVFAPTEKDFVSEMKYHDVCHRYHLSLENNDIFSDKEIMCSFLKNHQCAFVGGFVTSMLCGTQYGDVDIMFYNSATYEQIMSAAEDLAGLLLKKGHQLRMVKTSSSLSLIVDAPFEIEEFQFVYRQFRNKADILCNMDLGTCQCMWDGDMYLGTPMACVCLNTCANIFDLSEWGPFKEERLEKYFNYGFAVIFPNIDMHKLSERKTHVLPYLKLHTEYHTDDRKIFGRLEGIKLHPDEQHRRKFFNYIYQPHCGSKFGKLWKTGLICAHNIKQSKQQDPEYILYKNDICPGDVRLVDVNIDLNETEFFNPDYDDCEDCENGNGNSRVMEEITTTGWKEFNDKCVKIIPYQHTPKKYLDKINPAEWYGEYWNDV